MCFSPNKNIPEKHYWAILDCAARLEEQMGNLFDEKEEWDEGMYLEFNRYLKGQWDYITQPSMVKSSRTAVDYFDNLWWTRWKKCRSEKGRANDWQWIDGDSYHCQASNHYLRDNFNPTEKVAIIDLHLRSMEQHGTRKYFKRCWKFWGNKLPTSILMDEQAAYAALGLEFVKHYGKSGPGFQILTQKKSGRQYDMGIDPTIDTCYFLTPYDTKYGKEAWNAIWTTQRNHMAKHGIVSGIHRYDKFFGTDHGRDLLNSTTMSSTDL